MNPFASIAILLTFQLIGEALVQVAGLPLPGPLAGMLLLFAALVLRGGVPESLGHTSSTLLQNMMLLFIPAIAGVMLHFDRVAAEWQPFLVACVVGAAVTLVVTALTFLWLLKRQGRAAP